jgi:hypothetical protein
MIYSIFFLIFFAFSIELCSQDYSWELKRTPEGINSPQDEFNPVKFDNQFMFTRIVSGFPKQYIYSEESTIIPYAWNQSSLKGMNITYPHKRTPSTRDPNIYFSSTYQTLKRTYLGIFELRDNTILFPLGQQEPGSFASHPCITSDGQTLFFSSDKEGKGGADIFYYIKSPKGDWLGPKPMEDYINSAGNEINPFSPHPDTLYYASDGHGGKGGFDILMSVRENGKWLEPIPIDVVNSEWNDMDFTIFNDTEAAFTSDRPGGKGKLDIYMLKKSSLIPSATSYLALTPTVQLIQQDIEKVENALSFRSFIFPRNSKLSIDDDAMIQKLGKQLLENQDAKVYMTIHPITEKIIDRFHAMNIRDFQIVIDSTILESMIMISMNSKDMYRPHPRIGSICNPQSFKVYISSVPENIMLEWEVSIKDSILKKGTSLPDSIQYNTNFTIVPFQDSLVIHAKGSNMMGMEVSDSLIIPIKRQIIDLSENLDTSSIPVIWHVKEMKAMLPHFFRYATSFTINTAQVTGNNQSNSSPKQIRLFVTDYNNIAVDNALKMLNNEPNFKEFTISKVELTQNHKLARMIRFTISRSPMEEYGNIIPVLIE